MTWEEAYWGFERQFLGWKDLAELANDSLGQNNDNIEAIELALLKKEDAGLAGEILIKLVKDTSPESCLKAQRKWLFLQLAWLFSMRHDIDDLLGKVEKIYSDFDYPGEIENIVRYMPVRCDYDPSKHSRKDNEKRLYSLWEQYLKETSLEMGCLWGKYENK